MSYGRTFRAQGDTLHDGYRSSFNRNNKSNSSVNIKENNLRDYNNAPDHSWKFREHTNNLHYVKPNAAPSLKRRKFSASAWEGCGSHYQLPATCDVTPSTSNTSFPSLTRADANAYTYTSCKRDRSKLDDDDVEFFSRDEIDKCSPSRKDGIDALREMQLRYSYCAFIQNLGLRLDLPQTTIGTSMVLCHRFFVRRSHACHDRFLISTAALFLAAKFEETPRPLNNVLRASCEIFHKQDLTFLSYMLPVGWFEQYRERVLEAEQMILTTLNFELTVQHPYDPLTSILNKLGLSQSVLVNLALNLVSEGFGLVRCLNFNQIADLSRVIGNMEEEKLGIHKISVLACMKFLDGGLICCAWKVSINLILLCSRIYHENINQLDYWLSSIKKREDSHRYFRTSFANLFYHLFQATIF